MTPTSTGFIAWTRLAPDPTNGGGWPRTRLRSPWEVASDAGFASVVRSGSATAVADLAHTVHVDVDGLEPDSQWWVRFSADGFDSPCRPGSHSARLGYRPLRFGFVSCQHYAPGYYTALRGLAAEEVDLWLHLGDYIYENAATGPVRSQGTAEIITLDDYRNRYGVYKTDPDLQAAHHAASMVAVWDDHEVDNNYAGDVGQDGQTTEQIRARRSAGYRAWFEYIPIRLDIPCRTLAGAPPRRYGCARERGADLPPVLVGNLATFHMLDGRQYRDPAPCDGAITDCPDRAGSGTHHARRQPDRLAR